MRYLSVEEILLIHEYMLRKFGGAGGLLDLNLLESAVHRPKTAFDGVERYKTVFDKCASLIHSLIKNHPFVDGNKRTSIVAGLTFLELNGYNLQIGQNELVKLAVKIESDKFTISSLSKFLSNSSVKK